MGPPSVVPLGFRLKIESTKESMSASNCNSMLLSAFVFFWNDTEVCYVWDTKVVRQMNSEIKEADFWANPTSSNDDMWTAQICFVVVLLRHAGLICPLSSHDFCAAVGQDMLGKVAWQDLAPILPSPPNPSSPLPSLRHRSPMAWHFRHISVSCGPRGFST